MKPSYPAPFRPASRTRFMMEPIGRAVNFYRPLNLFSPERVSWAGQLCFVRTRPTKQYDGRTKPFSGFLALWRRTPETGRLYQEATKHGPPTPGDRGPS